VGSFEAVARVLGLVAGPPHGADWTSIAALATGGPPLEDRLAAQRTLGLPERTRHAWLVEGAAWYAGALAGAARLVAGRPVRLDGEALWLRFGSDGMPAGLAARAADIEVAAGVEDVQSADREVVAELVSLLEGVVGALAARGPARARALWRHAADRVADGLLWAGGACGDPTAGRLLATAVAAPGTPLAIPLRFDDRGGLWRVSCCQSFRLEGSPTCPNCPLRRR
jgi:FhuF 2Fe-2S C-terminal domain